MKATLKINGYDITPYIAEEGLEFTHNNRSNKSVTSLDGTLYQSETDKLEIAVTLLDMSDAQFRTYILANRTYLASVECADIETGSGTITGTFYFPKPTVKVKRSLSDGTTYLSGISFTLTEK